MNHQIFERKLRSWVALGARLSQYRFNNISAACFLFIQKIACWLENESLFAFAGSLFKYMELLINNYFSISSIISVVDS